MKAKLIKQNGIGIQTIDGVDYYLILDGKIYHTNPLTSELSNGGKLSKENCDEIFGVVDFGKLANYEYPIGDDWSPEESLVRKLAFLNGVDKAMELNKDKLFTLEDVKMAYIQGFNRGKNSEFNHMSSYIQFLQQPTEIDVEIKMEYYDPLPPTRQTALRPKLDENGCLILKRI
jgi:uncharacterized protein YktA (UPF0223 family)